MGVALALLGCKPSAPPPQESAEPEPAAGSPASAHCITQGGRTELVDGPHGTGSVCVFEDGSRCEEFRLLRGQCEPKSCFTAEGICDP